MNKTQLFLKKNSSAILTVVGAGGVVATSVLSVKATPKALQLIEEAKKEKGEDLTIKETIRVAWKPYIPAVVTGFSTIFCIFGANYLNHKNQVSLVSAYALLENSYKEYRNGVTTLYGEEADTNVRNEIAKTKCDKFIELEEDEELFFEPITMRFFESTMSDVLSKETIFLDRFNIFGQASLNDYLHLMGLSRVKGGEEIGWSLASANDVYGYPELEFDYEKVTTEDGQEFWNIIPSFEPSESYIYY